MQANTQTRRAAVRAAFPHTIPVLTGFLFLGAAYGILMNSKGFAFYWSILMSAATFAGSMQFVAINLLTSAFNPLAAFFRGAPGTAFPPAPRVPHWLLRYRMRPMGTLCRRTGIPHSDGFPIFPAAVDFAGVKRAHRRFPDGVMI